MGIAAILVNCVDPFEQIGKTLLKEGTMWNQVNISQMVS